MGKKTAVHIRPATAEDLQQLISIENLCFNNDRLSQRSFKHFLKASTAQLLVSTTQDTVSGYGLVLFHRGTSLARIYSIAVHPDFKGQGLGTLMMEALESAAFEADNVFIRLEVSENNPVALQLYTNRGYKTTAQIPDYYENGDTAIRMERKLIKKVKRPAHTPYHRQSTDFTCGPSALIMAMKSQNKSISASKAQELNIWREATTIFMASGHGGTSPLGLAIAASHRGFWTELWVSGEKIPFIKTMRTEAKKEIYQIVHQEFERQIKEAKIKKHTNTLKIEHLEELYKKGCTAIVLISTYQLDREKTPHWVWVVHIDDHYVYINDPFFSEDDYETSDDKIFIPVPRVVFQRMMIYGTGKLSSAVIIRQTQPE
ncbi:MAG TPA: ribosomal-protein-alanine acetyltransferase [Gammaproteobacteria bacterium]|nr:ribosomal-protein-alanine acetyltransferase [Gammaproteobacteria bacterium]MEC8009678.1 GNAT family N-acetyltransferase/peptidase C39 family protein [Pseudomonadota bacterium]HBF08886.1 ribosomal-protein-alanine acetyltransferase [Gammaproteobacteria bacterium]HCK92798.1 ribosomal-protein-alanine acetyltransferase [Gammaproteobacteria bacterium]|tara:strand:- start:8067 stop:9185 length:1119 start_codon:yes stop_codon:yes gene_type:complete